MKKKQLLSLLLVAAMTVGLTACGGKEKPNDTSKETDTNGSEALPTDYEGLSEVIYMDALGDFYELYQQAQEETDADKRYALEALAEAKMLESGTILPTTSKGGAYVLTRNAPNTISSVLYGGDAERYETLLATKEFVTKEDWDAMRALYGELKGTGTYYEKCKEYLTSHGYTLTDTFSMIYTDDNKSWDVFTEWNSSMYEPLCLTFDRLLQYDCENTLQPSLAESYTEKKNDDGTVTYTFNIRKGVKWVDSQGREYADVTADDFVAGAEHLFDTGSGMEALWGSDGANIVNADEYIAGDETDFSKVGVKAVDDYTLEYTLKKEVPYFVTLLEYTTFAPLNRAYYKSQGGTFSAEGDNYTSGDYGKTQDNILYCGPYLVKRADQKSAITFELNNSYWNKDKVTIKTLNWIYDNLSDVQKTYDNAINGVTNGVGLTEAMVAICKADGDRFDKYVHVSSTDATSYLVTYNINRQAYANVTDDTKLASQKTDEQKAASDKALKNQHFRLALSYADDRASWNEQTRGADLKLANLTNSYTPGDFVTLSKDVTVEINGSEQTFKAGTYYGEILQAQLNADGYPIVAWNPETNDGIGGSTGYDGWYHPEEAVKELDKAIEELKAEGVEITEENPIVLDLPVTSEATYMVNRANAYKQSIEKVLGNKVIINLNVDPKYDTILEATYYTKDGKESNFDINDNTGWGPDFGDPCSYLGTLAPYYSGAFTKNFGIY